MRKRRDGFVQPARRMRSLVRARWQRECLAHKKHSQRMRMSTHTAKRYSTERRTGEAVQEALLAGDRLVRVLGHDVERRRAREAFWHRNVVAEVLPDERDGRKFERRRDARVECRRAAAAAGDAAGAVIGAAVIDIGGRVGAVRGALRAERGARVFFGLAGRPAASGRVWRGSSSRQRKAPPRIPDHLARSPRHDTSCSLAQGTTGRRDAIAGAAARKKKQAEKTLSQCCSAKDRDRAHMMSASICSCRLMTTAARGGCSMRSATAASCVRSRYTATLKATPIQIHFLRAALTRTNPCVHRITSQ